MTAILDKIAAGELLARRQDMLSNQLLSHALEQLLARSKRLRDTEAVDHQHAARDLARRARRERSIRRRHGRRAADLASALRTVVVRRPMRRLLLFAVVVMVRRASAERADTVYDPAITAGTRSPRRSRSTCSQTQQEQHAKLRRMARRLSVFTDLRRFAVPDTPRWRTHGGDFLYANGINDALIFGDPAGAAYLAVSHPVVSARALLGRLTPAAQRAMASRLATLELADAAAISAINDTGSLRFNGRSRSCRRSMRWRRTSSTHRTSRARRRCSTRSAAPS